MEGVCLGSCSFCAGGGAFGRRLCASFPPQFDCQYDSLQFHRPFSHTAVLFFCVTIAGAGPRLLGRFEKEAVILREVRNLLSTSVGTRVGEACIGTPRYNPRASPGTSSTLQG